MADQRDGGISWTDETWNPIRGCSRVSEGCRHCYAETVAHRFSGPGKPYEGLTNAQGRWNGTIRVVEAHLRDPLRWQRPRRVFVNSMSDLFHENVSDETIDRIFAVMALAPQHTFQVLTKRPERMRAYVDSRAEMLVYRDAAEYLATPIADALRSVSRAGGHDWPQNAPFAVQSWPLPNVWLGVSVEDQATADARIPLLLQTPAAVRFISAEPLLGPVDLAYPCFNGADSFGVLEGLHWVIVGGESGAGARPFDVEWARALVRQCKDAGVACFVKQLGARPYDSLLTWEALGRRDGKWDDPSEWPEHLRVQEFPGQHREAGAA